MVFQTFAFFLLIRNRGQAGAPIAFQHQAHVAKQQLDNYIRQRFAIAIRNLEAVADMRLQMIVIKLINAHGPSRIDTEAVMYLADMFYVSGGGVVALVREETE